jgi:hypothetical protein
MRGEKIVQKIRNSAEGHKRVDYSDAVSDSKTNKRVKKCCIPYAHPTQEM